MYQQLNQQEINDLISAMPVSRTEKIEDRLDRIDVTMKNVVQISKNRKRDKVDISSLNSAYLDENPDFQYLKGDIIKWNKEIEELEAHKMANLAFRNKLYDELESQLFEVVNTKNRLSQQKFLQDVKFWYDMQLQSLQKGGKNLEEPQKFQPRSSQSLFRSNTNTDYLSAFKSHHRTKYEDIEPAEDRVKEFGRKFPGHLAQQDSYQNPTTRPTTQQGTSAQNWFTNSLLKNREDSFRPQSSASNYRNLLSSESPHRQLFSRNIGSSQSNRPGTGATTNMSGTWQYSNSMNFTNFKPIALPSDQINEDENGKPIKIPASTVPEVKNYVDDRQTRIAYEQADELEFKKFNEMRGAYSHYIPTDDIAEVRLEQKWLHKQHKELAEKREEEEFINYMKNWATHKGQYEEEMMKKHQYLLHGSRFHNLEVKKPLEIKKEEVTKKDFNIKELNKEEEEEEVLYQNYLKIKNLDRDEKAQQKYKQDRIATFVDDTNASIPAQDLKDDPVKLQPKASQMEDGGEISLNKSNNSQQVLNSDKKGEAGADEPEQGEEQVQKDFEFLYKDYSQTPRIQSIPVHTRPDLEMSEYNNPPQPRVLKLEDRGRLTQTSQGFRNDRYSNVENLEYEMKKAKIAQIRQMRGEIINQKTAKTVEVEDIELQRRKDLSMSVYTRKKNLFKQAGIGENPEKRDGKKPNYMMNSSYQRYMDGNAQKTNELWKQRRQLNGQYRPFSCVYSSISQNKIKRQEISDFQRIKNSFSKNGIRCSAKTLSQALITPQTVPNSELAKLPPNGLLLFENKFAVVKKKKKKKGGKKK